MSKTFNYDMVSVEFLDFISLIFFYTHKPHTHYPSSYPTDLEIDLWLYLWIGPGDASPVTNELAFHLNMNVTREQGRFGSGTKNYGS